MVKVVKKLEKKKSTKSKETDPPVLLKKEINQFKFGSSNLKGSDIQNKKDVSPFKASSDSKRPTYSNKEKKRMERREVRTLKLQHARGIQKRKKITKGSIAKKIIKGKSVDDLISNGLVTKSQATVEKSKKYKGGRKGKAKKLSSLEDSLSELKNAEVEESKPGKENSKKERRKKKREDLLLKLHGGIDKKKKKKKEPIVKKIADGKFEETLKSLFESDLVTKKDSLSVKEVNAVKVNPKTKDHKDRRVGFDAYMDVFQNPDYKKDPFELMSKSIREHVF